MTTVLMILLKIVHMIPQKSYVCNSYITDKKSLYAGGGCIPHPPLDLPLVCRVWETPPMLGFTFQGLPATAIGRVNSEQAAIQLHQRPWVNSVRRRLDLGHRSTGPSLLDTVSFYSAKVARLCSTETIRQRPVLSRKVKEIKHAYRSIVCSLGHSWPRAVQNNNDCLLSWCDGLYFDVRRHKRRVVQCRAGLVRVVTTLPCVAERLFAQRLILYCIQIVFQFISFLCL